MPGETVDELKKCNPCIICGSNVSPYFSYTEDMMGGSLAAVQCGNKKCHITGEYSRQKATAVKKWNQLKQIHDDFLKTQCPA